MSTYTYTLVGMPRGLTRVEIAEFLNGYGLAGWELCAIDYGCFIFKSRVEALKDEESND